MKSILKIGMKVIVPFSNKEINGFVIGISDTSDSDYEIKSIAFDPVGKYLYGYTPDEKIFRYDSKMLCRTRL